MVSNINNFNLLISTSRYNEENAKAELWFTLLICGIEYPIISKLSFSGLLIAFVNEEIRDVIEKIKKILKDDPKFFQYILKIIPIDFVCESDTNMIEEIIKKYYMDYIEPHESFMINLKRRKSELIDREHFVNKIANILDNKVNLTSPDKIIWIEVLGNRCGISFIRSSDIISIN
jgi:tRNA acetyltransferase TAN1